MGQTPGTPRPTSQTWRSKHCMCLRPAPKHLSVRTALSDLRGLRQLSLLPRARHPRGGSQQSARLCSRHCPRATTKRRRHVRAQLTPGPRSKRGKYLAYSPCPPSEKSVMLEGPEEWRTKFSPPGSGPEPASLGDSWVSRYVYFGSPTAYPCLRPMMRYLCAGVGVVVRILINILAGRECACVCV